MMKSVTVTALLSLSAVAFSTPAAFANASCHSQAKAIKAGQKAAKALKAERDALLEEVEVAGDEWEAAEDTRLFGAEEASKADAAKRDYDALKAELVSVEEDLQGRVSDLNADVAAYNKRCATKK